uniref:Uncharacterized protein n=1 Tax=Colobus angolensis palliatus TaxID=336983 RepID=A0A2K5HI34_COLAP
AVKLHGGIDILVSTAAASTSFGSLMDITEEIWDKLCKDREKEERMKETLQITRLGKSEDYAGIVSFLCSEDASYITEETVVVGGGTPSRL